MARRIGEAICREEGKTLKEAIGEQTRGGVERSYFASDAQRLDGITMPSDRRDVTSVATRVPIGVVTAISSKPLVRGWANRPDPPCAFRHASRLIWPCFPI
ncbi:MAG: aldehyde dehydrogenase family protein [Spirochaetales bacterium]|nr:MAG: aldehyde dehydrogenase family protein [Spirochaetales bacterium]